jgi:hypothetical protein
MRSQSLVQIRHVFAPYKLPQILQLVPLRFVVQVSSEERKEIVHFGLKELRGVSFHPAFRRKRLTFFSSGSITVSARLLRAFRIWLAATEVEVFSKAWSWLISTGAGAIEGMMDEELRNAGCS